MLLVLVLALCYTGSRLIWAQQHFRPVISFDEELHVVFDIEHYGLTGAHTLTTINGLSTPSRNDIPPAYDQGPKNEAKLIFSVEGEDIRPIEWIRTQKFIEYSLVRDSSGTFQDNFHDIQIDLTEDERIFTINGITLAELAENPAAALEAKSDGNFVTRMEIMSDDTNIIRQVIFHQFDFSIYWTRFVIGGGFGIIGLIVFWIKSGSKSAVGFLIFSAFASLFWMVRSLPFQYRIPAENYSYYVLQCFLPLATAVFIFTFTPIRLMKRTRRIGYAVVTIFCMALFVGNIIFYGKMAQFGILGTRLFLVWGLALLTMLLFSLPMDWWLRIRGWKISPTDIQRAWVLRIALLFSFLPVAIYTPTSLYWDKTDRFAILFDMNVLLFPLLIGYAILRHNLLQLSELALESVTYLMLLGGMVTAYIVGTSALLPALTSIAPADSTWPRPILLAGILALATPLHHWTRRKIDERYSRTPFEFERFLHETENSEKANATPFEYAFAVLRQLSSLFRVEHTALFLRFPGQDIWTLSAVIPAPETGQPTEDCSTLLAILEEDRKSISRDEVLEDLRYRFVQDEALKGMNALHASVIVPLISRDRLIGALCLGEKAFHKNYSREELALIKRIATHIASSLFNLMGRIVALEGRRIADIYPNYPERIGDYAIKSVIGEGGMSYVYLGAKGRDYFAIKVPSRMVQSSSTLLERFQREIQAVQRLDHENIIHAHEFAWEGPEPYIVFDYYAFGSISDELKDKGPFSQKEAISVGRQVASGLAAASQAGIVHRDIKPSNLFRTPDGTVKIADFGLARISDASSLTLPGQIFGTPSYIAPELLEGESATIYSDQFALGITLVEILTGSKPIQGETIHAVTKQQTILRNNLLKQIGGIASPALAETIKRLLSEAPRERYESYEELSNVFSNMEIEH